MNNQQRSFVDSKLFCLVKGLMSNPQNTNLKSDFHPLPAIPNSPFRKTRIPPGRHDHYDYLHRKSGDVALDNDPLRLTGNCIPRP
jgi:hypothetical protein